MKQLLLSVLILAGFCADAQDVYTSSGRPVNSRRRQEKEKGFNKDNIIYGGGLSLQFGNVTNVGITPVIGYKFSEKFAAGVGLGYGYVRFKDFYEVYDISQGRMLLKPLKMHSFSGSIWARYIVFDNVFVHAEPEYNIVKYNDYPTGLNVEEKESLSIPACLVGAGYRFQLSDRASMVGMLLYDVVQDENSPYRNRIFPRLGFNIGF